MVNVLVLGGHGKIAQIISKILAQKGHQITSVIRDPSQSSMVESLQRNVAPLVSSLEESTPSSIRKEMENINWVVWSAGAGGKGGPQRTKAVDEIAAKKYIDAAVETPSVDTFLMVSASVARRVSASWWDESGVETYKGGWDTIGAYCEAKTAADEYLYEVGRKWGIRDICLRPGRLSDDPATGLVSLGRCKATGEVARGDVADVAVRLLESDVVGGLWIDMIGGDKKVEEEVSRVVRDKVTAKE
ncbi:unnamed protein product [Tuber melanosporum]|uniref:(Perigord truffle) hypothetical protein n=1 Tax=Tuber melanosporum (strain Mel28) TaxID=656061 RepID=D5GFD5_TUBMM|nr:uncharacterized protein GSTUM_00006841001 [Tuber melanosporum]CAZ83228.1 unnamed protein product [Tuber melanosporum]